VQKNLAGVKGGNWRPVPLNFAPELGKKLGGRQGLKKRKTLKGNTAKGSAGVGGVVEGC